VVDTPGTSVSILGREVCGDEVMSIRNYGRVTPLQMDMLGLGGEVLLSGGIGREQASDDQRLSVMRQARQTLTKRTGRDFGYDLAAWHRFLLDDAKLSEEYTFTYAWKAVKQRIDELLDDPDRLRLERLINEHPDAGHRTGDS
jgi:hypothetical protein